MRSEYVAGSSDRIERVSSARADGVVHCRACRVGTAWRAEAEPKQRGDYDREDVLAVFNVTSIVGQHSQQCRQRRLSLLRAGDDDRHKPVRHDRPGRVEHDRESD